MNISTEEPTVADLLVEHYYTLSTTGANAIAAIWGDFADGNFSDNLVEWGMTESQFIAALNDLALNITHSGMLFRERADKRI
jgi:hypothetical protein